MTTSLDNRGLTDADVVGFMDTLSNWGRWGAEDQLGTLNYLTPEKWLAAASLIRDGQVVSISLPWPVAPGPDNPRPALHYMIGTGENPAATGSTDFIGVAYHGRMTSHIDALCHFFWQGKMYNGFPTSEVRPNGAHKNAIPNALERVVGRGVLLDIPPVRGREWLEPGEAIYAEDLDAAEARQGISVGEGDILLVRTGRHKRTRTTGAAQGEAMAGLHSSALPWLRQRRIAVLGGDGVHDVVPSGFPSWSRPIHVVCIVAMGIHLLDNHDFERLAEACAARNRYEFFFVLAPLFIERGTGSPATGLAIF